MQLGEGKQISEHLRFDWDLRNAVGLAAGRNDLQLLIRSPSGEERKVGLRPMVTEVSGR